MSDMANISRDIAAHETQFAAGLQGTQKAGDSVNASLAANTAEVSEERLQGETDNAEMASIPTKQAAIAAREQTKTKKAEQAQESVLVRKDQDEGGLSGEFSQRQGNKEYHLDPLLLKKIEEELGKEINEKTEPKKIIEIIRDRLTVKGQIPDPAFVDKAFEFLIEAAQDKLNKSSAAGKPALTETLTHIIEAKNAHATDHAAEIQVAQRIIGAVDAVVESTGQPVKAALDRCREVVHNPPDIQALRKYYEGIGLKAMMLELKGLNSYLGGNLKRTNLDNPELAQLAGAARKMQGILGVFRQAKAHFETMVSFLKLKLGLE